MLSLRKGLLFILCACWFLPIMGQQEEEDERSIFSPGLTPVILDQGELEVNYFGGVTWLPEIYSTSLPIRLLERKQRILNSTFQFTYGFFKDPIVNLGLDLGYVRTSTLSTDPAFPILYGNTWYFTLAPRIRWAPLKKILPKRRSLFLQHQVVFPLQGSSSPSMFNQLIYREQFGYNFLLQAQAGWNILPAQLDNKAVYGLPVSLLLGWLPTSRLSIFALGNYSPLLGEVATNPDNRRYIQQSGTHLGGGIQLAYSQRFSLFLLGQAAIGNYLGGGQNSFNLGFRLTN
ncbi:MAG: hypothetical protein R3B47_07530 [Bacteroidia bacterium]